MKKIKSYYILEFEKDHSNDIKLVIKDLIIQELNGFNITGCLIQVALSQFILIKQNYINKLQFYTTGWLIKCNTQFLIKELKTVTTFSDYLINVNSYVVEDRELISKIKYSSSSSSTTFWEWYNNAN